MYRVMTSLYSQSNNYTVLSVFNLLEVVLQNEEVIFCIYTFKSLGNSRGIHLHKPRSVHSHLITRASMGRIVVLSSWRRIYFPCGARVACDVRAACRARF